ncbi:hypothetical protein GGR50DRAFT_90078 [Xylaria sp. CBS 124048]|nr:hypothetical protein GGR50DRAFT_90078 [Xylaria sp. CBS 124048]
MAAPFPCPIKTWRSDTYENISPLRPELSTAGKTVVIIGAGSGIGRETALAFAAAGATRVALLGRTKSTLDETAARIQETGRSSVSVSVHVADITSGMQLQSTAALLGTWDILVLASAYCPQPSEICTGDVEEWWKGYEINVKGTLLTAQAFLPTARRPGAAFIGVASDTSVIPTAGLPQLSSYISSKLAQAKIFEFLAAENKDIFVAAVHPGMIETPTFYRTGATPEKVPMDKVQLPAHFMVWLASPEASFLRGHCVWANWDVEELKAQKDKFVGTLFMTLGSKGLL